MYYNVYNVFILIGWLGLLPLLLAAGHFANRIWRKSDRMWPEAFVSSFVAVTVYTLFAVVPFLLSITIGDSLVSDHKPPPSSSPGGPSITVGGLISFLAVFFVIVPLNYFSLIALSSSPPRIWHPIARSRVRLGGVVGTVLAFFVVVWLVNYSREENRRKYQEKFRPPPAYRG
jgi:uncharacterized membrane protein